MESTVQIQINADGSLDRDPGILEEVEQSLRSTLGRFEDRLTRVEVHLSDVGGREDFRKNLVTARACGKVISGKGAAGYLEALDHLYEGGCTP
jgi:3-dehydroquinate dehydratase-2